MAELRHALRAYAVDGYGPAEVLRRLERMLRQYPTEEFATLCVLILEREVMTVANAGHLPPLLVTLCDRLLERFAGVRLDDIALLVLRRQGCDPRSGDPAGRGQRSAATLAPRGA